MIGRATGVFKTTYRADMAVFPLPLAQARSAAIVAVVVLINACPPRAAGSST